MFSKTGNPISLNRISLFLAIGALFLLFGVLSTAIAYAASFDFAKVEMGSTRTTNVTIYNYENDEVTITSISFSSNGCPDFSVLSQPESMQIPAGGSLEIVVQYTPSAEGACSNVLRIWADSPIPNTVAFSGIGIAPKISAAAKIQEIFEYLDMFAKGAGRGKSAGNRITAIRNMLKAVAVQIHTGQTGAAYHKLSAIYKKVDGVSRPIDFLQTHETKIKSRNSTKTLAEMIKDLMAILRSDTREAGK